MMARAKRFKSDDEVRAASARYASLREKPTRIVVGEVRGAEAHTLLKAWNTGHPGGMATVHANDAMSGLIRLESLVAEATNAPQQTLIAETVDLVIFVEMPPSVALDALSSPSVIISSTCLGCFAFFER